MFLYGLVWFGMDGHGLRGLKMAQNSSKWLKIVAHGLGMVGHVVGHGLVWATIWSHFELF